ncbi:hypothetical protein BP6252_11287 [Coleophoma cylindrospora]|uniref:USP domain-containing protein n=1 Tax=Coleophoma cylindrospora TaxID=1849047 RepID=A0A3D8QPM7_9HELO|nr:hypothetical protein BP6252_11287 [Coleophoma cylindrospora]
MEAFQVRDASRALKLDESTTVGSHVVADAYPGQGLNGGKDQIRCLEVLPGDEGEVIRCNLRNVNFDTIKECDAVSYTWGLPPSTETILVNDTPFRIRRNLFDALLHLRQPSSQALLWVDAICINQADTAERNQQVQRMADIFSGARRVLVWLGLETVNTRLAFSFLAHAYLGSPSNRKELMNDPGWDAVKELCENDYWKRVWIVQEICLAPRVAILCGRQQIPWKYISELRNARKHIWPQYHSPGERGFLRSLPARIDQQKEARLKAGCVLWTLLENFKDSLCQEIHDKIYGFLGLSTDCGGQGLTVDYSKSVDQVYRDVIWFYYKKFRKDSSAHHAAQLMKLSEFLQDLLRDHPRSDEALLNVHQDQQPPHTLQHPIEDSGPMPSTFVSISACNVMVIDRFISSDEAKHYQASELVDFLEGKIPYSHVGYWRDFIEADLKGVYPIPKCSAYASIRQSNQLRPGSFQKVDRPSVFIALPLDERSDETVRHVVGIAPAGSETGDVVLSFVDSHIAIIMRSKPESNAIQPATNEPENLKYNEPKDLKYRLTGSGALFLTHSQNALYFKNQLMTDKSIETTRVDISLDPEVIDPFPAILWMDLATLQTVTQSNTKHLVSGFSKPTLELMPSGDANPDAEYIYAHRLQRAVADSELLQMQASSEVRRYALGPGYTAISNPGSIGYVISALQILYMLKPFRMAVLSSEYAPDQRLLNELRQLFWGLQNSHLPVSPLGITESFGWGDREINEVQDFSEFWRLFIFKLEETSLSPECTKFMVGATKYLYKETWSTREEAFYDLAVEVRWEPLSRLEGSFDDYFFDGPEKAYTLAQLPEVLILNSKSFRYDMDADKIITYEGNFEYPSELDLAKHVEPGVTDTKYQLHGVVVLEDVKPVPRYLLYLRPRQEDQWILFFKETVSYAQRSEVFEDNFRREDRTKQRDAPLRTPYIFVYLKISKLDHLLG